MKRILLLLVAFVLIAIPVFAPSPCANLKTGTASNIWTIPSITEYSGMYKIPSIFSDECGLCDLGSNAFGSLNCASGSYKTLDFQYTTKSEKTVNFFKFDMVAHNSPSGFDSDIWDIKYEHPFMGIYSVMQLKEGIKLSLSNSSVTGAAISGGIGCAGGAAIGAAVFVWTGPVAIITGGAGCLIGLAAYTVRGVGDYTIQMKNVGAHSLGNIHVILDHDNDYEAQVDLFDMTLNPEAFKLVECVYDTPLSEWQKIFAGVTKTEDVFSHLSPSLQSCEQLKKSANVNVTIHSTDPWRNAVVPGNSSGIMGLVEPPKYNLFLEFERPEISDFLKELVNNQAKLPGDAVAQVVEANQTVKVTKKGFGTVPGTWDGKLLVLKGIYPGDELTVQLNIPGFKQANGSPGVASFTITEINATDPEMRIAPEEP